MGRSAAITAGMMLVAGARAQLTQQTGASRTSSLHPARSACYACGTRGSGGIVERGTGLGAPRNAR